MRACSASASITSRSVFDLPRMIAAAETLETRTGSPDFWEDAAAARATLAELKRHKDWIDPIRGLDRRLHELIDLHGLATAENDAATLADVERDLAAAASALEELELRLMLGGEDDAKTALLSIHPGTGGLESQDWAEMLLRLYTRYCERQGWQFEAIDLQAGDGAGIKSATLEVSGEYAYGRLKSEAGVHRLIRISPFDANQRRQTSFASVSVLPEVEDIEVEINDQDLRVDTYRASGAGGQHVNKTSSAVRITHLPTKIVVQCQNERSQLRNRESAMKILRARLYEHYKRLDEAKRAEREPEKKEIGFGSQIRTYTFQPYTLVKDHRTGVETGDVQAVMDGRIQDFVEGYLKWANEVRQGPR
jgi:peptide chain release factor 2